MNAPSIHMIDSPLPSRPPLAIAPSISIPLKKEIHFPFHSFPSLPLLYER